MVKFKLYKLVRDGIVKDQKALGQTPHYRVLEGDELRQERIRKMIEEAGELFRAAPGDRVGEYADLQQLIDEQMAADGITKEQVQAAMEQKNAKKGAFSKGIFIETLEVPDSDEEWLRYYRSEPERFPEVQ